MNPIQTMVSKGLDEDIAIYLNTYAPTGFPNMFPHFVNLEIDEDNYRFLANQLVEFVQQGLTE